MFSNETYENIKKRILSKIKNIDTREGSYTNNTISPVSEEFAKANMNMSDILSIGFIKTGFNEFLELRASEAGIYRKEGKKATGSVNVIGKEGTVLTNGTIFICDELTFVMLNDIVLGPESNICYLEATEVGYKYNVLANSTFNLMDKITGIDSITNELDFTGGIDIEDDESLRNRYDEYMDDPPTSGNASHYKMWALEVDGVDRAIVYPRWDKSNGKDGRGTVKVMIIAKDNKPVTEDILNECISHINNEMPLSDIILTVVTPTLLDVVISVSVNLKDGYDLVDIKYDFENGLNEYLKDVTNELVYSKVYGLMASLGGVEDVISLTLNGNVGNISIPDDKIVNISSIDISEVV